MNDLISRQAAIDGVKTLHDVAWKNWHEPTLSANVVLDMIRELPSAQPDNRLAKIAELVEGTVDHFDLDDAMDLLYQIKEVLK